MATDYLTQTELQSYVDTRLLQQLGSDSGSNGSLTGNTILGTAIGAASAEIDMAATVGQMYTTDQLADLYTAGDKGIRYLCAALTLRNLYQRHSKRMPETAAEWMDRADKMLEALHAGQRVFAVEVARVAGVPSIQVIGPSTRVALGLVANSPFFPPVQTGVIQ